MKEKGSFNLVRADYKVGEEEEVAHDRRDLWFCFGDILYLSFLGGGCSEL